MSRAGRVLEAISVEAQAYFNKVRAAAQSRRDLANKLAEAGKPVRMSHPNSPHLTHLISPDMSEPGKWRNTTFSRGEPVGHMVFDTPHEAFFDALQYGARPAGYEDKLYNPPSPRKKTESMTRGSRIIEAAGRRRAASPPLSEYEKGSDFLTSSGYRKERNSPVFHHPNGGIVAHDHADGTWQSQIGTNVRTHPTAQDAHNSLQRRTT